MLFNLKNALTFRTFKTLTGLKQLVPQGTINVYKNRNRPQLPYPHMRFDIVHDYPKHHNKIRTYNNKLHFWNETVGYVFSKRF